jgi:hypothetical protein
VKLLFQNYPYLTRHYTRISPDEMTIDPSFDLAPGLSNVSNVHDLSSQPAPWVCSDDPNTFKPVVGSGPPPWMMAGGRYLDRLGHGGAPKGWLMFAIVGLTAAGLAWRGRALAGRRAAATAGQPGVTQLELGLREAAPAAPSGPAPRLGTVASGPSRLSRLVRTMQTFKLTRDAVVLLFLEMLVLQGIHEMEHIVQVFQRTVMGIGTGAGMLGSVFDVEPVHMVYNAAFLFLLGAVWIGCKRDPSAIPMRHDAVMMLLKVSFVFQVWHSVEHVVKMYQFIQTGLNGTPGILGYWIPVVYLHLGYNTLLYAPIVAAFFVGGFHTRSAQVLSRALRGRRRRSVRPRLAS